MLKLQARKVAAQLQRKGAYHGYPDRIRQKYAARDGFRLLLLYHGPILCGPVLPFSKTNSVQVITEPLFYVWEGGSVFGQSRLLFIFTKQKMKRRLPL